MRKQQKKLVVGGSLLAKETFREEVALRARNISYLKVTFSCSRNLFMPESKDWGELAVVSTLGLPSNTITLCNSL